LGYVVAGIWAIVLFIRLIVAINKSDIFSWKNVRRLRRLGTLLLASFAFQLFSTLLNLHYLEKVFAMEGYSISYTDMVSAEPLLFGLSALIVAEIFAIGLRLQEEQELTV
jgi:hypothetical protein